MTPGAAGHRGYFHEAAFYGSDGEFLALVVPFLEDGLRAGEPTLTAFGAKNTALVRAALGERCGAEFLDGDVHYSRPASAIRRYREAVAGHLAGGATQIRIVGDVPHPGLGLPWEWWARYEAATNHAFEDFPLWGLCPYDTRTAPPRVLADVARTHPVLTTAGGEHAENPDFEEPARFLGARSPVFGDPLQRTPPAIDLIDPTPAEARRAVLDATRGSAVDAAEIDHLVVVTSEAVTNALCHGRPPLRLRLWSGEQRAVVTVSDLGSGPTDPFAGLLPPTDPASGGIGLWMAHQLCSDVTLHREPEGFTIRLVVGVAHAA
ncbi:sensor histidine kinase [Umezawaea beigongshangensis]|uniref:sensor histidine kinase n=1 Tax=Umezawaea beigongshangensis TaxID=2780383 RepID=UPI0018F1A632|nr:sensor histidine kinase [Umezawaea beigongshangensis]